MKKFLVKRYLEVVNPEEVAIEDREYAEIPSSFVEMYGMEEMQKLSEFIYQDDDSADLFWIRKDEHGYYVETYSCVQTEEVNEEEEIFELFKYKLIEIEPNIFASAETEGLHAPEFEDCIVIVKTI